MEKTKLIQARTRKGYTQQQVAEYLCIDVSNYSRREKGTIKINNDEWDKISKLLEVPIEDIYEAEENNVFIFRDSSIGNYLGTNNFYSIPEYFLDNQRKYIEKLEEEIRELKKK